MISFSTEVYLYGIVYAWDALAVVVSYSIVAVWFIPIYHRLKLSSIYEVRALKMWLVNDRTSFTLCLDLHHMTFLATLINILPDRFSLQSNCCNFYFSFYYICLQYLELRFNKTTRLVSSFMSWLNLVRITSHWLGPHREILIASFALQLLYLGLVVYMPAIALSATTSLSVHAAIIITGIICTFYTAIVSVRHTGAHAAVQSGAVD